MLKLGKQGAITENTGNGWRKTHTVRHTSRDMGADSKVILKEGLAGDLRGKPLDVSLGIKSAKLILI